jgi:selenocysteine-specific elongation factor
MYVIGTAGHVDHGKSTLITALTGINPDRLAEEKAREMTIDLGFAWMALGDGEEVGVVDVPGHRDFIENMLAGVGGIDLALLVVAADEGVMPQTVEHLAILDLLKIQGGIVALTKLDLVDDEDWLDLVALDLSDTLAGTVLADAPIVPVSAKTGQGLDELKQTLGESLRKRTPRPDLGRPRLPVDRVFSLFGFGTVVTGTLTGGSFQLGDNVVIQPAGLKGRIRGLQTHNTKRDRVLPGSRVAVNLTGVGRDEIRRGDVIAAPGVGDGTILLDAFYKHLADSSTPLKHNMQVKLFVGAAEVVARARVLGVPQIEPGEEGWLQLALTSPVSVLRGDRFILRRPSPGATLGGGTILDPYPGRRHRRFRPDVIRRLQTLAQGTPEELLLQTLTRIEPATRQALFKQSGLEEAQAAVALEALGSSHQVVWLEQQILSRAGWQRRLDSLAAILTEFHRQNPLRLGISREELRSRLKLTPPVFNPLVSQAAVAGLAAESGALVMKPGHRIAFTAAQSASVEALLQRFAAAGIMSPSVKEAKDTVGEDVYFALIDLGRLKPLNSDVVYAEAQYDEYVGRIRDYLASNGRINAAQARDLLGTSRKYAIALLEHLDDIKLTQRVGDDRELLKVVDH